MNEVTDVFTHLDRAKKVKLLLLDVDGVLTDGKLYFSDSGNEIKAFNILDGFGIKMLQEFGVQVGIITGRKSELVARRAVDLGIDIVVQGSDDKGVAADEIRSKHGLAWEQVAFMGDDYPDLVVMCRCGLALTVSNAHRAVAARAHWQTKKNGGEGAVREACDMILQAQGAYESALEKYLR
jgi:3-deoxy-D-manno-octulosonate 8-phosphate phosphatase (KDO 8-P phosphatase)